MSPLRTAIRRPHPLDHLVVGICAVALIVTYRWTWHLWQVRPSSPGTIGVPNLPAIDALRGVPAGPVLVIVSALMILLPRPGTAANAVILLVAMLGDETRMQPEVISLALLALTVAWGAPRIARSHLAAMWLWAGLNKALSYGWASDGAPFIAGTLHLASRPGIVAWGVPALEILLGLSAIPAVFPILRTTPDARSSARRSSGLGWITGTGATALHLGILLTLGPWLASFNSAVWPWNAALACCAPLLFIARPGQARDRTGPEHTRPEHTRPEHTQPRRSPVLAAAVAALMLVLPAGFYAGVSDAYLSHNLYTSNTAGALRCSDTGCTPFGTEAYSALNVPLPPETRIYAAWFRLVCHPGETLEVTRPRTRITGEVSSRRSCRA